MKNKRHILAICRQKLKNVESAVRAYNMYKNLEVMGCKVTYVDGWRPSFTINKQNLMNWIKILSFKHHNERYARIFIENVQWPLFVKFLNKINIPIVLDVRDDQNLHAESMGIDVERETILRRELDLIDNFEISQKILLQSKSYFDYYSKKFNKKFDHKFIFIMNASDPDRFINSPLHDNPRIGMLGGANWGEGIDLLLEASRLVRKEITDLSVHIGYKYLPYTKDYVEYLHKNYKKNWIHFYEDISYTKNAPDFYSSLYLCVIPRKNTEINNIATPSKLFDSMASARPLVVTNCKEQAMIVKEEKCGLVCDFTPEDMAEKIVKLLEDKEYAQRMGQNGRRAVEERHNWKERAKQIIEVTYEDDLSL